MATSLIGPPLVERALAAAPVPRPPQPTRATWMVFHSPACTSGRTTPARADAAAILPDCFIISRRDGPLLPVLLMMGLVTRVVEQAGLTYCKLASRRFHQGKPRGARSGTG